MSHQPCLIVCEHRGLWAVGLRRHLPREIRLCETRGLSDCRLQLAAAPRSLLVLETTPGNLAAALELVAEVADRWPLARVAAVASRGCEAYEWLLREAGAIHFSTSPRQAAVLAHLAVRHAERLPTPRVSFATQIWDSLPWPDAVAR
jgi:hypothetical protein